MSKRYSIADARNNLSSVVHDVEHGSLVELTRRGQPVAVLLSFREYQRLLSDKTSLWDAYMVFRQSVDLKQLQIEPSLFEGLRDTSPGRGVNW